MTLGLSMRCYTTLQLICPVCKQEMTSAMADHDKGVVALDQCARRPTLRVCPHCHRSVQTPPRKRRGAR
jgi:hypothetical protein